MSFYIKREDLSSPKYGGNKVRTLEHILASCVEHKLSYPSSSLFSIGSAGSNMNVASVVHGQSLGLPVRPCSISCDAPDFDNTLNLLSILSFDPKHMHVWTQRWAFAKAMFHSFIRPSQELHGSKIMPPGGNNLLGVLGQMGGLLELAEQIQAGDVPNVDVLYVPVGSSCTLTGLVLGLCLARHLNLAAFQTSLFHIVAVPVHPGIAKLQRFFGLYKSSPHVPLFPRFGFRRVAAYLMQQGLDVNLEPLAIDFLKHHVHFVTDPDIIGEYGTHSVASLAAATHMDVGCQVEGSCPLWSKPGSVANDFKPWLCGHFASKPFAKLMHDLHLERAEINGSCAPIKPKVRLLWLTKSYTQPRGDADEWTKFSTLAKDKPIREWAEKGRAYSLLRPGHINLAHGSSKDYRHVMTFVGGAGVKPQSPIKLPEKFPDMYQGVSG
ncbi:hypothetical protein DYB32_008319 [Aphanomyces invadans]|uniref:Tryptophan synthase beta chain-like PALP domain-containing protein n=1 Tax=Aphanomyces invadans TaxID=157072 RepID=A0A3R6YZC9_9STRA|nr:hypothetical protein DYB32_008319 [Aphanomyces invadans]